MSQKRVVGDVYDEDFQRLSILSGSIRNGDCPTNWTWQADTDRRIVTKCLFSCVGKHSPPRPETVLTIASIAPDFDFELLVATSTLVEDYVMFCLKDSRGREGRAESAKRVI